MSSTSRRLSYLAIGLAVSQLTACGLSDVGNQEEPAPKAVATALAQPFTTDSTGTMNTTVRAGADVILSGKESQKGADDTGVPLIKFTWVQVPTTGSTVPDAEKVQLIYRTANTVSFTAPEVTQDNTKLSFKLTVSDAKGATATANAVVTVRSVRDADHFLQYLPEDVSNFKIVFTTATKIGGNANALPTTALPVDIKVTKLVTFKDRNGTHTNKGQQRVQVPVGTPVLMTANWSARVGTNIGCTDKENPALSVAIPRINLDDVINRNDPAIDARFLADFPAAILLSDVIEAADVDDVKLEVKVELSSSSAAVVTAGPKVCLNDEATSAIASNATPLVRDVESLYGDRVKAPNHDPKLATQDYYNAIDPAPAQKDTLNKWLTANGFVVANTDWSADTHAIYANNYDLGFGRDMYMKFNCEAGFAAKTLQERKTHCDVAAVVVNYVDVEAAAKKLNPILAVAMEYSAAPGTAGSVPRFVKFYTFAPDTRDGQFYRVSSVNLDRRGEQYMPQACVVCHGGNPSSTGYPNVAGTDIKASFLPWDLDSLLYSDTDPGFSSKSRDADMRAKYTRTQQETSLKRLNEGAYLTYFPDPIGTPTAGRYELAKELVEKWYGGANLPNAKYDDSTVPSSWVPNGTTPGGVRTNNPARVVGAGGAITTFGSDDIYRNVFARNCRSCHVNQVPTTGDPREAKQTPPGGAANSVDACSDTGLANANIALPGQAPVGCYWEFAHAKNLVKHLGDAQMPFARRTTDRLWIDKLSAAGTSATAGEILQTQLKTATVTVPTPGTPLVCIDPPFDTATAKIVTRNDWTSLDSTCSRFLSGRNWTLTVPTGSTAGLVGSNTSAPRFFADRQGDYTLTLSDPATSTVTVTALAQVPVAAPVAGSGTTNVVLNSAGTATATVDVMQLAGSQSRDDLASLAIVSMTGVTASVIGVTNGAQKTATMSIQVNSLAGGTVTYRLTDIDTDQSAVGSVAVNVSASIAANDQTITVATNGSSSAINLAGIVSSAQQPFTLTVTQPTVQRFRGLGNVTQPNGGAVTYTAPPGVTSHFGGQLIDATGVDHFTYRACFVAQPTVCDDGTITVQLQSTRSFPNVQVALSGSCASCHAGSEPNANPNYQILSSYADAAARKPLYCLLKTLVPVNESNPAPNVAPAYLNLTTPAYSLIYRKPQGLDDHQGANVVVAVGGIGLQGIFDWINEGAYFTESSNQGCP